MDCSCYTAEDTNVIVYSLKSDDLGCGLTNYKNNGIIMMIHLYTFPINSISKITLFRQSGCLYIQYTHTVKHCEKKSAKIHHFLNMGNKSTEIIKNIRW